MCGSSPLLLWKSLFVTLDYRNAASKTQHGNFLVAIKQEKGEAPRLIGEKPHGEEEVSPLVRPYKHTVNFDFDFFLNLAHLRSP